MHTNHLGKGHIGMFGVYEIHKDEYIGIIKKLSNPIHMHLSVTFDVRTP
jgi:hypothetical protein